MNHKIRTYTELIQLPTFEERFEYVKLAQSVCEPTFGGERIFNQMFYNSKQWKIARNVAIVRDTDGHYVLDLAHPDHRICGRVYVHHLNPITIDDIRNGTKFLLEPEYLVCVSFETHQALTYGSYSDIDNSYVERTPFDTCPWRLEDAK